MKEPETGKKENTGKSGYSITTWRLHLWCRHPEWLRTTQEFYNRIAEFYYNLLLDHTDLWEMGSQQTLRELEIMSIPGRGGRIPSDPLPWQKVPLYFRRAAANEGIASAKSYLSRFAQDEKIGRAEKLNAAVTYYKGMYQDFSAKEITLRVWTGDTWTWMHCRLSGRAFPENARLMSPSVVFEYKYDMLHVPVRQNNENTATVRQRMQAGCRILCIQFRNEVAGITDSSVERLFAGYAPLIKENNHKLSASHSSQAEEYYWDAIEKIQRCDWNIGYVGRSKQYVDNITKNIAIFADRYPDKTINVIILGEILDLRILEDKKNVICTKLGFKFPFPKSFFRKLDVAIAGAGSATLCCREHVPTIVADAGTTNAAGILGYTVSSSIFNPESDRTYCEWLEDILVDKKLEKMKQIYEMPKIDVNKVYQEHMEFIYKSEQSHEYFDFIAHPQKNYTFEDKIKYFLKGTFPGLYKAYKLKRG